MDIECGGFFGSHLGPALSDGAVSTDVINTALVNLFLVQLRLVEPYSTQS
jgi:hypothetical protein